VDPTVVAQALADQSQVVQQRLAVTIRIAVQALPDKLHLLAIHFARIPPLQRLIARRAHGRQQGWGDAHFFGRLREMVTQAGNIVQIHVQGCLV